MPASRICSSAHSLGHVCSDLSVCKAYLLIFSVLHGSLIPSELLGSEADTSEARDEFRRLQLDQELEAARIRHWDPQGWVRGGAAPAGRVLDVNSSDPALTAHERASMLAELSIDLPRLMADFEPLRDGGMTDDGHPLEYCEPCPEPPAPDPKDPATTAEVQQQYEQLLADARAFNRASAWVPCDTLDQLLAVQDAHPPPREEEVAAATAEEEKGDAAALVLAAEADAISKRYAVLVTYGSWLITRAQLLLDWPVGWDSDDSVRYRFAAEQLQRAYGIALQSLAYSAVHALPLAQRLEAPASDAMARQSWAHLGWTASRLSYLQQEALLIHEHLQQWSEDDRQAGIAEAQAQGASNVSEAGAPLPETADVHKELAAVHAFCGAWSSAVSAEHAHLEDCASRAEHWALAMKEGFTADAPEYGLQHYAGEALPALTRMSHALLQYPTEEDRELQELWAALPPGQEAPLGEDGVTPLPRPHYRDVLAAVHLAQFAVGAVWRFANLLDHRRPPLRVHLAEAAARQQAQELQAQAESKGKHSTVQERDASALEEVADKLALHLAQHGARSCERLAAQHAVWPTAEDLQPRALLETAVMQSRRSASLRRGVEVFLHFMDRVPCDSEAAAACHPWSLATLMTREDSAAAHQQLGRALQAWAEEEKEMQQEKSKRTPQAIADAKGLGDDEADSAHAPAADNDATATPPSDDPHAPLSASDVAALHQCAAVAFETARRLSDLQPRFGAALKVQEELEAVPQADIDKIIDDVKKGHDLPKI